MGKRKLAVVEKEETAKQVNIKFGGQKMDDAEYVQPPYETGKCPTFKWADNSVDGVIVEHYLPFLEAMERFKFLDELYRVMKKGTQARIISRAWSNADAYSDWRVKWPPVSGNFVSFLTKEQRDQFSPGHPLKCDFEWVVGASWDQRLNSRHEEVRLREMTQKINSQTDVIVILTKK